jgi:predicted component of type VI protein secretion system
MRLTSFTDDEVRRFNERDRMQWIAGELQTLLSEHFILTKERAAKFPELLGTGISYGIRHLSEFKNSADYAKAIHQAILWFESRLLPETLSVTPYALPEDHPEYYDFHHCWLYVITADMPVEGILYPVRYACIFDLESGRATVSM